MSASKVIRRVTYNEGGFTMLTSEESEHGSFHLIDTDTDTGGIPIHDEWYDSERRAQLRFDGIIEDLARSGVTAVDDR